MISAFDDYCARLPAPWFEVDGHVGRFAADGMRFVRSARGVDVVLGDVGRRLFMAHRRAVAAWARTGFDVLVDEVALDAAAVHDWGVALDGLDVVWVAVRCDVDVLEAREAARGDRAVGLTRTQAAVVHEHAPYRHELDTTHTGTDELVARLIALLDPAPT